MAQAIVDRGKKEKGAGMTQDIIDMVKQAGWKDLRDFDSEMNEEIFMGRFADLEYFAKLVAAKTIAELESQEPFCYVYKENGEDFFAPKDGYYPADAKPLYTHPPQRKPLTDFMVEMSKVLDNYNEQNIFIDGWLSAEAAHGIKE